MPRFSANLSMMFTERPLPERFAAARAAEFAAVELQYPYAMALDDLDRAVKQAGVELVLINIPAGDHARGDRGLGCLPDRVAEFRTGVEVARRYAERLGVRRVNLLAGVPPAGADPQRCRATLIENVRYAARALGDIDIVTCIEPINTIDVPGFLVSRSADAIAILDEAAVPNTALQYDIYHMHRMGEPLIPALTSLKHRIGHIQFSDLPDRREPSSGAIDFAALFATVDAMGYAGWVGAEYRPSTALTENSLGWFVPWRDRQPGKT